MLRKRFYFSFFSIASLALTSFLAIPPGFCNAKIQDEKESLQEQAKNLVNDLPKDLDVGDEKEPDWQAAEFNKRPRAARVICQKQLLPALSSGNHFQLLAAVDSLVVRQTPETVEAVEDYCRSIGHGVLSKEVTEAIVQMIDQRVPMKTQAWKPVFTEYVAKGLDDGIKLELEDLNKHQMMQDPLTFPKDWRESDQLFGEVHVWKNRFLNLDLIVRATLAMNHSLLEHAKKIQNEEQVIRIEERMTIGEIVRSKYDEMHEREAELRIEGLIKAEQVLREEDDFETRLNAAFALELHGGELDQFFQKNKPGTSKRERLNDVETPIICRNLLMSGRKNGKDVIQKALLLRIGAHWWLRGRYGSSSLAYGLLKPELAMRNKEAMFGLFMPKERPKAIGDVDSETGLISPGVERRHYYTWAVERRDANMETKKFNAGDPTSQTETLGTGSKRFY